MTCQTTWVRRALTYSDLRAAQGAGENAQEMPVQLLAHPLRTPYALLTHLLARKESLRTTLRTPLSKKNPMQKPRIGLQKKPVCTGREVPIDDPPPRMFARTCLPPPYQLCLLMTNITLSSFGETRMHK